MDAACLAMKRSTAGGGEGVEDDVAGDARCLCGSLVARWAEGGIELKCRRCRRMVLLSWRDDGEIDVTAQETRNET